MTRIQQRDDGPRVKIAEPSFGTMSESESSRDNSGTAWHKLAAEMSLSSHTLVLVIRQPPDSLQSSLLRLRSNRVCARLRPSLAPKRPDSFRTRLGLGDAST